MYDTLVTIRGIAKLTIDIYMFPRFYFTFYFFVNAKRDFIKREWGPEADITVENQLVIWSVMLLWFLNILYSLSVAVVWRFAGPFFLLRVKRWPPLNSSVCY